MHLADTVGRCVVLHGLEDKDLEKSVNLERNFLLIAVGLAESWLFFLLKN